MNEELKILITAEISKLKQAVGDAQKTIKSFADKAKPTIEAVGKAFKAMGDIAVKIGKVIGTAMAAAATAIGVLAKKSLDAYSDYQQLSGGVETLYKDSANIIMNYANQAYKTAGISANKYMEQATSFAAGLVNSLGGDTAEAARIADMAIIDMSDNANKMGTDIESIQNAYQGFAKGNFTMLDNLKLGYGGTKEEMERLLADAEKISGIHYDINNISDIYEAIHVVQTEYGITGTTAEEAATTIQGSTMQMKAAWENLIAGMMNGEANMSELTQNMVDSIVNMGNNIIPAIMNFLPAFTEAFTQLINQLAPMLPPLLETLLPALTEGALALVNGLISVLPTVLTVLVECVPNIIESIMALINAVLESINQFIEPLVAALPQIIEAIVAALPNTLQLLIDGFITLFTSLASSAGDIILPIVEAIPDMILAIVEALPEALPALIQGAVDLVMGIVENLGTFIELLVPMIPDIIIAIAEAVINCIPTIIQAVLQLIGQVILQLPKILEGIAGLLGDIIEKVIAFGSDIWDSIVDICDDIVETFSKRFNDAKEAITDVFDDIKEAIKNALDKAKETVENAIEKIKGFFDFKWELPKLKMPTFKIVGKFSWDPISVPKLTVSWNAKGGVFDNPTLFNFGNTLQGLGESGAEAVVPLEKNTKWLEIIADKIAARQGSQPIILQVDGKTFAEIAVDSINDLTKQRGSLPLCLA